jgi:two-component system phosphate regulon response regulator PhoB/two-component system alkaline phosphatase synthesis response regulator PhoP
MPNRLIAIVDDEPDILELVSGTLERAGFRTVEFPDAERFHRWLDDHLPDLLLLDLMLPDADGLEICRRLRAEPRTAAVPVVMLTAKAGETDKVLGLELGADDYVTKPFSPRELVARVKAVLRRREAPAPGTPREVAPGLAIDANRFSALVDGARVDLTTTEFRILDVLAEHPGWVHSRDDILNRLWGHDKSVIDRTVDVHITNLRRKLGRAGALIKNVRGVGYKLEVP